MEQRDSFNQWFHLKVSFWREQYLVYFFLCGVVVVLQPVLLDTGRGAWILSRQVARPSESPHSIYLVLWAIQSIQSTDCEHLWTVVEHHITWRNPHNKKTSSPELNPEPCRICRFQLAFAVSTCRPPSPQSFSSFSQLVPLAVLICPSFLLCWVNNDGFFSFHPLKLVVTNHNVSPVCVRAHLPAHVGPLCSLKAFCPPVSFCYWYHIPGTKCHLLVAAGHEFHTCKSTFINNSW